VVLGFRAFLAGQSRAMMWIWYGAGTMLSLGAGYLFTLLATRSAPDPVTLTWQFLATVVLFPVADVLIQRFEDADVRFR
jgi:rod shape-determining protein MreD